MGSRVDLLEVVLQLRSGGVEGDRHSGVLAKRQSEGAVVRQAVHLLYLVHWRDAASERVSE